MTHDEKKALMLRDMYVERLRAYEMGNMWWAMRLENKIREFILED